MVVNVKEMSSVVTDLAEGAKFLKGETLKGVLRPISSYPLVTDTLEHVCSSAEPLYKDFLVFLHSSGAKNIDNFIKLVSEKYPQRKEEIFSNIINLMNKSKLQDLLCSNSENYERIIHNLNLTPEAKETAIEELKNCKTIADKRQYLSYFLGVHNFTEIFAKNAKNDELLKIALQQISKPLVSKIVPAITGMKRIMQGTMTLSFATPEIVDATTSACTRDWSQAASKTLEAFKKIGETFAITKPVSDVCAHYVNHFCNKIAPMIQEKQADCVCTETLNSGDKANLVSHLKVDVVDGILRNGICKNSPKAQAGIDWVVKHTLG